MTPQTTIRFPRDSNIHYLPLVYFLPEEIFTQCPTLRTLPRCFSVLAKSEAHIATLQSDQFLNEAMTATARLIFPHFGFRGWVEHYTGYCPAWNFAYTIPVWAKALKEETGWDLQFLFDLPKNYQIPFFDMEYVRETMKEVAKRGIAEQDWQPILDVVREIPCEEDFERWDTNVRKDFLRKWYHTRSKRVQMVSLEACIANKKDSIHQMTADSTYVPESVEAEDFAQRFKERLTEKDMAILELRVEGHTYEEIADKLDYKNHSGVIKRMRAIKKAFIEYENEQP